jgi:hypothetical protein
MRWDNLFDDLEGQLEHELSAEELDVRAEEERLRLGRLTIRDRLLAIDERHTRGAPYSIRVFLSDGSVVAVRPMTFGRDWLSADVVDESARASQCIIPIAAIASIALTRDQLAASLTSEEPDARRPALPARLSLGFVLRDLCRRRSAVELRTQSGVLRGTIDRVGRDHLDLAVHESGEPRRDSAVSHSRLVPLAQVVLVRL